MLLIWVIFVETNIFFHFSAQQMRNRFNIMGGLMGDEEEEDQDSIKEAFLETNFYLLVLTFVVSIVHSVFEFLAFKNGKWKNWYCSY